MAHPLFGCIKLFSLAHHDATRLHGPAHGRPRCRRRAAAQYHQFHALWVGTTGGKLARHQAAPPLERFAEGGLALDTQVRMRLSAGGGSLERTPSSEPNREFHRFGSREIVNGCYGRPRFRSFRRGHRDRGSRRVARQYVDASKGVTDLTPGGFRTRSPSWSRLIPNRSAWANISTISANTNFRARSMPVVEDCVNAVGVDVNTASTPLLSRVLRFSDPVGAISTRGVREQQVSAAISLLDGGATVPFVARYRKEATGALDDAQLRTLQERLSYLREPRRASGYP